MSMKHHFVPEFYLRGWAATGTLVEYSRPDGKQVRSIARAPGGTGYDIDLYKFPTLPPHLEQAFEEQFTKQLDTEAGTVFRDLLEGREISNQSSRSAWSRFVYSMILRNPEEMEAFRQASEAAWDLGLQELQERYASTRSDTDPEALKDYLVHKDPAWLEREQFGLAQNVLDHEGIGTAINEMHWFVRDLNGARHDLLTSDRPVIRSQGMFSAKGFLTMPLSPSKLFIASVSTTPFMLSYSMDALVKATNTDVVESAVRQVYAKNRDQEKFISNRFGVRPRTLFFDKVRLKNEQLGLAREPAPPLFNELMKRSGENYTKLPKTSLK